MDRLQSEPQNLFILKESNPVKKSRDSSEKISSPNAGVAFPKEMRKTVAAAFDAEERQEHPELDKLCQIAERFYEAGNDPAAVRYYNEALAVISSETPVLFQIYKNLGNISVRSGDYDSAEEFYNKAFTINPDSDVLLVNYGTLEIQRENYEKSRERFRQSVTVNPNNDRGWVGLALVHRHFGDHELAWANLERSLDINCENETALHLSIDWAHKDLRVDSTIERIHRFVALHPERQEFKLIEAKLLVLSGRLQKGAQVVTELKTNDYDITGLREFDQLVAELLIRQGERAVD